MEFTEQSIQLLIIAFASSFIAVFIAAATNKVTVFKDYGDLWMTLGLILWPTIGITILTNLQGDGAADIYFGTVPSSVITIGATCLTLFSLYKTFINSISANGLIIGIVIGIFKAVSSIIIIFSVIGFINRITEKNKSFGNTLIFITIFTWIFAWILKTLVNGHRVKPKSIS